MTIEALNRNTTCSGAICSGVCGILPPEVARHILLNYLEESRNVIAFGSTNRHLYTIIFSDQSFIHGLFKKSFPQSYLEFSPEEKITTADFIQARLRKNNAQSGDFLSQEHPCTGRVWRLAAHDDKLYYVEGSKIKVWEYRTGDERELKTSILPKKNGLTFIQGFYPTLFSDDAYLLVGNEDSTTIFDHKTEKEIFALAHDDENHASHTRLIHNNQLFFGFKDGTIRIWDLKEPTKAPKVLQAHSGSITTMLAHNNRLYIGTVDGTIEIWDLNDMCELRKLKGTSTVLKIFIQDNSLIAEHGSHRQIWDLEHDSKPIVVGYDIPLKPHFLHRKSLYCTTAGQMVVQNPNELKSVKVFSTNDKKRAGLSHVTIHDGLLFGLCSDIKIWKDLPHVKDQSPSYALNGSSNRFIIHKGRLFASTNGESNHCITVWDFNRPQSPWLNLLMQFGIVSQEDFMEKAQCKFTFFSDMGIHSDQKLHDVFSEVGIYSDKDLEVLGIIPDYAGLEKLRRYLQQYKSGLLKAWEKYNLKDIYQLSQLSTQPELFQEFSKSFLGDKLIYRGIQNLANGNVGASDLQQAQTQTLAKQRM